MAEINIISLYHLAALSARLREFYVMRVYESAVRASFNLSDGGDIVSHVGRNDNTCVSFVGWRAT